MWFFNTDESDLIGPPITVTNETIGLFKDPIILDKSSSFAGILANLFTWSEFKMFPSNQPPITLTGSELSSECFTRALAANALSEEAVKNPIGPSIKVFISG